MCLRTPALSADVSWCFYSCVAFHFLFLLVQKRRSVAPLWPRNVTGGVEIQKAANQGKRLFFFFFGHMVLAGRRRASQLAWHSPLYPPSSRTLSESTLHCSKTYIGLRDPQAEFFFCCSSFAFVFFDEKHLDLLCDTPEHQEQGERDEKKKTEEVGVPQLEPVNTKASEDFHGSLRAALTPLSQFLSPPPTSSPL